jgi:hypothetical protein
MPGSKPYRVHPLAWLEIDAAADWYEQRSEQASVAFIGAVFDALESAATLASIFIRNSTVCFSPFPLFLPSTWTRLTQSTS